MNKLVDEIGSLIEQYMKFNYTYVIDAILRLVFSQQIIRYGFIQL